MFQSANQKSDFSQQRQKSYPTHIFRNIGGSSWRVLGLNLGLRLFCAGFANSLQHAGLILVVIFDRDALQSSKDDSGGINCGFQIDSEDSHLKGVKSCLSYPSGYELSCIFFLPN